jgi:hypothetical protein
MKKFSKITGQKVNEEPKVEIKIDESELFRNRLMNLMDQFLSVQTYGPIDRYQRAGLIKIAGKEHLVEALLNLLQEKSTKDQTKLLEGLKSEIKDWEVIDNKIQILQEKNIPSTSNRNKFNSLVNKYDGETLVEFTKESVSKITDRKVIEDYTTLVLENKSLDKGTKSQLVEIYNERLNQLV